MNELDLTFACWDYDRTQALRDGSVRPDGINLRYLSMTPAETFWRQVRHAEFDVCESSISGHIMRVARGDESYVAIPAFTSRVFRHGHIWLRAAAGIERPEDLKGRRVGLPEYHMSAALFSRGLLADEFGIGASDITWVQAGAFAPGREERERLELPPEIEVIVDREHTLDELIASGGVDALLSAYTPTDFAAGAPTVTRLFPDPMSAALEYYQRTGVYPIMHLVLVRREIADRYPWVLRNLFDAFVEAKDRCLARMGGYGGHSLDALPFYIDHVEQARRAFGPDLWPYGVEANRATLEAAVRYSYEQGLSPRPIDVDELFPASVLDRYVD